MRIKLPAPKVDRWAEGVDHEPESDALARLIGDMDLSISEIPFVLSSAETEIMESV